DSFLHTRLHEIFVQLEVEQDVVDEDDEDEDGDFYNLKDQKEKEKEKEKENENNQIKPRLSIEQKKQRIADRVIHRLQMALATFRTLREKQNTPGTEEAEELEFERWLNELEEYPK
ncbi:MAG: hypothetical protein EZS28_054250, partial [Streblomastix strix]